MNKKGLVSVFILLMIAIFIIGGIVGCVGYVEHIAKQNWESKLDDFCKICGGEKATDYYKETKVECDNEVIYKIEDVCEIDKWGKQINCEKTILCLTAQMR